MTIEAWYMDDSEDDQRAPHRQEPNKPCHQEKLVATVLHFANVE